MNVAIEMKSESKRPLAGAPWPLLVANALFAVFLLIKPGSPFVMKVGSDIAGFVIPLGAAIWCAWVRYHPTSRELPHRQKSALTWASVGLVCYSAGMALWIYYEGFRHQD